ncbi:hypothetical protein G7Y89_g13876 [Cudoniella acicularis]|uniref:Cytochrome P450 n=1 Tax=Cudoniella acicularis TaxID=354080 RepID=A0A8H4VW07_9HELO|nr:hypothetical protein G7Y89_g13876 [Cudoniella acicularis]
MSPAIGTLALCVVFLWLVKQTQTAYISALSQIPNAHPSTPFSRLWMLWNKLQGRQNRARFAAHERLGPVVRIGPQELSINCIDDGVRTIYGSGFDKHVWTPYMFTMLHGKGHAERKRMFANVYSKSYIQNSLRLKDISRVIISGRLRNELVSWASHGGTVDVLKKSKACLMDLTSAWIFGLEYGTNFLEDPKEAEEFFTPFRGTFGGFFWRSEFHHITRLLQYIGVHLVPKEAAPCREKIQEWCSAKCVALLATKMNPMSSASQKITDSADYPLVYSQLRGGLENSTLPPEKLERTLSMELLDHMVAGHDATGITMAYLLYELSQRQSLQRSLRAELKKHLNPNPETLVHHIDTCILLDAILKETLRLYSANPGPWPRVVPSEIHVGHFSSIPAGTIISASSYALHRNSEVFPRPEEWRPERWLDASDTQRKEMMRWFWAFGSGSRMCIGSHLAIHSEFVLVFVLVFVQGVFIL